MCEHFQRRFCILSLATLACLAATGQAFAAEPVVLAEGGRSDYRIVVAEKASPSTRYAAEELQRFFKEAAGAELSIVTDESPAAEHEILLGDSSRLAALKIAVDFKALGNEGYVIRTVGPRVVIAGGALRGNLYGVYQFLEDQLGCRWFTPAISRIPKADRVAVAPLDVTKVPALEYREVMLFDCWEADWMARNRVNTTKLLDARHGGAVRYVPGYYVHTFKDLVPPAKYFADHPEYFSEVDGKRIGEGGQLCCTNDDVAKIATDEVLKALREHPEASIISVSQNDNNKNFCQCPRCAALNEKEGSPAGQVLFLVNRVAEAVAKEFPDRVVGTLAYEWSLKPPKTIKPRDNVSVRLCTIRCSFSEPLETQPKNRYFRRILEGWGAICSRVSIWDYTCYFSYYLLPWPNYRVMDDNIRYFVKNNVRSITAQNNWNSHGAGMAGLKGYLLARFLWDPEYGEAKATTEFLEGVYGPAAPHIQAYLDLLADKVEKEHIPLPIYGSRTPPYLTLEVLKAADALWEKAAAAVADQPELLKRVQVSRLSLDYAYIEHYRWKPEGMVTYQGRVGKSKVIAIDPAYKARIERFLEASKDAGITHITDDGSTTSTSFDDYIKWLKSLIPPDPAPSPAPAK